jgi:hypothetical protein
MLRSVPGTYVEWVGAVGVGLLLRVKTRADAFLAAGDRIGAGTSQHPRRDLREICPQRCDQSCALGCFLFLHNLLSARRIDDGFGVVVHERDFGVAAVERPRSPEGG